MDRRFGRKGGKKKQSQAAAPKQPKYTVDDLLAKAEEYIESYDIELAEKFYQKALDMEPNNTIVLDSYASLLLEMDDFDRARALLEKSIQLEPEGHYSKYMNMGQLHQGLAAIRYFEQGIKLMIREKEQMEKTTFVLDQEINQLKQQISSAFCNAAEIYLTDACFEENAESECCKLCDEAMKWDPVNPEPYQTMASLRISQQKNDEALAVLEKGFELWRDAELEDRPSYEFRHNVAKTFLELEQPRLAAEIWEGMLEEDDNIAEVWYYLGLAYRKFNSRVAQENLEKAKILLKQTRDLPFLKECEEILAEVKKENIEDTEVYEETAEDSDQEMDM